MIGCKENGKDILCCVSVWLILHVEMSGDSAAGALFVERRIVTSPP